MLAHNLETGEWASAQAYEVSAMKVADVGQVLIEVALGPGSRSGSSRRVGQRAMRQAHEV